MKKLFVLIAAVLVLAGCSASGKTLESLATVDSKEDGITEISKVVITSRSNKLTNFKSEVEYQYPTGGAGMGDKMTEIRSVQDTFKDIKSVTYTYSIDGDNISVSLEIDLKNTTDADLAVINEKMDVAFTADADAYFTQYESFAKSSGAAVTIK